VVTGLLAQYRHETRPEPRHHPDRAVRRSTVMPECFSGNYFVAQDSTLRRVRCVRSLPRMRSAVIAGGVSDGRLRRKG
jgi:hypothetical protein